MSAILSLQALEHLPGAESDLPDCLQRISKGLQSAAVGPVEMSVLIVSITLCVLPGTWVISPHRSVPLTACADSIHKG